MPKVEPVPPGFRTVTPHLVIRGVENAIEFYKKAFGAKERFRMPGPDGASVLHAEVEIGDSIVMLADEMLQLAAGLELQAARRRMPAPHEIAGLHRLILAVDTHGVVRQRAAEVAPPGRIRVIRVGAGVDQDFPVTDFEHEAQRIGVAVGGDAQVAQWPGVGQQAYLVGSVEGGTQ